MLFGEAQTTPIHLHYLRCPNGFCGLRSVFLLRAKHPCYWLVNASNLIPATPPARRCDCGTHVVWWSHDDHPSSCCFLCGDDRNGYAAIALHRFQSRRRWYGVIGVGVGDSTAAWWVNYCSYYCCRRAWQCRQCCTIASLGFNNTNKAAFNELLLLGSRGQKLELRGRLESYIVNGRTAKLLRRFTEKACSR